MRHSVIHINYSSWVFSQLFFLFKGSHKMDWCIINLFWNWTLGHSPIDAPLWTPPCTIKKQMCSPIAHLFSLCISELNFGQTIWEKSVVLLGISWGTTWGLEEPFGNLMGTHWEQGKNQKNPSSTLPPQQFLVPALLTTMLLPPLFCFLCFLFEDLGVKVPFELCLILI